ncbi:MAG: cytochrome c peroxidase [Cyclobacteriaceae bacterium]
MKQILLIIPILIVLISCSSESDIEPKESILNLPEEPYQYLGDSNRATLGRVLFYDPQLSVNNAISCASCHKQELAFSDNRQFSRGFDNRLTTRNSMPIQNIVPVFSGFDSSFGHTFFAFSGLFWDGRGTDHSTSLLLPIINHVEMGIPDLNYLVDKLSSINYYPELFEKAFGPDEITPSNIGIALNEFLFNIQSNQTKFDKFLQGNSVLSPKERLGRTLFFSTYDCNSCHQVENPNGYVFAGTFANVGLDKEYTDPGLEQITNISTDNGKFKIPSLRNVALTGPYMHDGRFSSLEEVIKHYGENVEDNANLDFRLRDENGSPVRFEIPDHEVQAIISFLGTLTDFEMITDERLSSPFITK